MKIKSVENNNLPKLSWLLRIETDNPVAQLKHGSWVECDDDFFVEGVWEGDYENKDIHKAKALMGSGGRITDESIILCCPSHTSEGLFSISKGGVSYFSNSIPFILSESKENLDKTYLDYENDILSISDGLNKYKRSIPTQNSVLNIHYFSNLKVNSNGDIKAIEKERELPFVNFKAYYNYLLETLELININASHSARKKKFEPITFCSNGYDSATCAALGKKIGCDIAVVYESKRKYKSDSGKEVVKALGYNTIIEKEETDYLNYNIDYEFVSSGELGTSIFFASSEKELEGKFLLSGLHGDKVWGLDISSNDDLKRSFFPDTAKKEFRLRVGFINVIVPFIGVTNHRDIFKISQSEEMKPWTLGNDYDRPIPRRIVEEQGVPRSSFGINKEGGAGSSLRFANLSFLKKNMSPSCYEEFETFYLKHRRFRVKHLKRNILYLIYCADIFLYQRNVHLLEKIFKISKWDRRYKCSPWAPSYLFHWGVEKLKGVYSSK